MVDKSELKSFQVEGQTYKTKFTKKYINRIKSDLQYCEGCQPSDSEEQDGFFWILGDRIQFMDCITIKFTRKFASCIWGRWFGNGIFFFCYRVTLSI